MQIEANPGELIDDVMGVPTDAVQGYISEMLGELQIMALKSGLTDLSALLSAARNAASVPSGD